MNYDESRRLLRDALDILIPVVAIYLFSDGLFKEAYETAHNFPVGSHFGQIFGAGGVLGYYFGVRKRVLGK